MTTYLVTGANRGIGQGFINHLASLPNSKVIGTVRDLSVVKDHDNVSYIKLSYSDSLEHIKKDLEVLGKIAPNGVDVVISNVGIAQTLKSISEIEESQLNSHFEVNVVGAIKFYQAILPHLNKSDGEKKLIFISSVAGLTNNFPTPGFSAYGISKAALNYAVRQIAIETTGKAVVIAMHPGLVDTDMSRDSIKMLPKEMAETFASFPSLTPDESVQKMTSVIEGLAAEDTGSFISYDGEKATW